MQLLGSPHHIHSRIPYTVDSDVQLVCKYLQAYSTKKIDSLYRGGDELVKFSTNPDLTEGVCHELLQEYMNEHITSTKITQKLFIR